MTSGPRAPGVVVVGGAVLFEVDSQLRLQRRIVQYLERLRDDYGDVVLLARTYGTLTHPSLAAAKPNWLVVHPLGDAEDQSIRGALNRSWVAVRDLWSYARQGYHVVHFFPDLGGPLAVLLLKASGIRWLSYWKSDWPAYSRGAGGVVRGRLNGAWWDLTARMDLRWAHAVVARDPQHLERLRARRPDARAAAPIMSVVADGHGERRRRTSPVRLLFVGTQTARKGLDELIEALGLLHRRGCPVELRVVGADPGGSAGAAAFAAAAVQKAGVDRHVSFAGYIDDPDLLAVEYEAADVFVLPARFEGFPRAIDEAMAAALPVITTNLPGITTTLREGEAVLVARESPHALADAICAVLTDDDEYVRLSRASRQSFERRIREGAATQHIDLLTHPRSAARGS